MSFLSNAEAEAINAYHHKWQEFSYIFPPFNRIPSILRNILEDKTPAVLLIHPYWPSAAWSLNILRMCLQPPVLLRHKRKLLHLPQKTTFGSSSHAKTDNYGSAFIGKKNQTTGSL